MRSFPLICLTFLLLATACNSGGNPKGNGPHSGDPVSAPPLDSVFQQINREVAAHSRAYETLKEATETIGHRLTGSENGAKAEQYAFDLLKSYGFEDVAYFDFSVTAWSRDTVSMMVSVNKQAREIPFSVVSLAHSPVTFAGEASVIDMGNGLRSDFEKKKAEVVGKFALLNLWLDGTDSTATNLHRTEKTALAVEYGAAGVIFVNGVDGDVLLTGAASVTGELITIPAVCIGKESGEDLRAFLEMGPVSADIAMKNKSEMIQARNVTAIVPGRELPEETIVIGGHLDSWDLSTGAIDNGIGSFTVMEIARVFKALQLHARRSVQFVLFMGEEQGLLGSTAMVEHLEEAKGLNKIKYVLNLDMTGNPIGFRSMGRTEAESWLKELGDKIHAVDSTFQNTMSSKAGLHSDHQPFMLQGIPILGLESNLDRSVYRFYHSNGDDFSLVNKEHLDNCVRFAGMIVYALADAEQLPALRFDDTATRNFLVDQGLKEKLVLGKEWKWEK